MSMISVLSGPVIGSIIGYGTNYIAVKMLFRPLKPVKLGSYTLPFTPGIFPKRKEQLAKALGSAVGNNLLTTEDMENMFLSEEMKAKVLDEINGSLFSGDDSHTIKNILAQYVSQEKYEGLKVKLEDIICEKVMDGFTKIDIGTIIVNEGGRAIKEKTKGTMMAMFINDDLINSMAQPIGQQVEDYARENGPELIKPIVREGIANVENEPNKNLMDKAGLDEGYIKGITEKIYAEFVHNKIGEMIKSFDIPAIVEKKVNDMDVLEIEKLVLSVMKNELNAVVNLGAVIGFVIGLLNLAVK
ncbi:MAG: hypothetical protein H6Q58_2242 [Firmicutes bacterium]|nr:hypothetical protein [Bacillota bacterium]